MYYKVSQNIKITLAIVLSIWDGNGAWERERKKLKKKKKKTYGNINHISCTRCRYIDTIHFNVLRVSWYSYQISQNWSFSQANGESLINFINKCANSVWSYLVFKIKLACKRSWKEKTLIWQCQPPPRRSEQPRQPSCTA